MMENIASATHMGSRRDPDPKLIFSSMPIKSSGRIVPPGWAPLQPKQSVLSLIV